MEESKFKSKVMFCNCYHEYQDKVYGKQKRLHNYATCANNKMGGYRCTVCASVKK